MKRATAGFTLMELLVSMAIASVLMVIAVPSLMELLRASRLSGVANDFYGDLMLARVEALKRGRTIIICPSADGSSCTASWTNRRLTFVDTDGDGAPSGPEEILYLSENVSKQIEVKDDSQAPANTIRFRPLGTVIGGARAFSLNAPEVEARSVCLRNSGQAFLTKTGQDCP